MNPVEKLLMATGLGIAVFVGLSVLLDKDPEPRISVHHMNYVGPPPTICWLYVDCQDV